MDVRSPAEFAHAHIPGAISLPLFSNEERAVVGKIYKENGHDAAVSKGLSIAGPKAADLVDTIRRLAGDKEVLLHCWRAVCEVPVWPCCCSWRHQRAGSERRL